MANPRNKKPTWNVEKQAHDEPSMDGSVGYLKPLRVDLVMLKEMTLKTFFKFSDSQHKDADAKDTYMKKLGIAVFGISLLVAGVVHAEAPKSPKLMSFLPQKAFIPSGFDSNDQVQIVMAGFYPDTCYKSGPTMVKVDQKGKRILLRNGAYIYPSICLDVIVPYTKIVDAGILSPGKYTIMVEDSRAKAMDGSPRLAPIGAIDIAESSNVGPDDYLYAPVTEAYLEKDKPVMVLRGLTTSTCMKLKEIKVTPQKENTVVVIQPIVDMAQGQPCSQIAVPFEVRVNVPTSDKPTLFHIRALNGHSLNVVAGL